MAKLKIYTTGPRHFVTPEVAQALGLPAHRLQAEVYVAAYTKAEAFRHLTATKLAPPTVSNKDFRVAEGKMAAALVAAGALSSPGAIAATRPVSANTPAVWVSADGHGCVQFGEFVRGQFIPHPDLVAGGGLTAPPITENEAGVVTAPDDASELAAPAEPAGTDEEAQLVRSMLYSAGTLIRDLEDELARKRQARGELVLRALKLNIPVEEIAEELGVVASRVYQMRDKALADMADRGEFRPGMKVEVEIPGTRTFPVAEVIPMPDGAVPPNSRGEWVWVRYAGNGSVLPVRPFRLRRAVPSCSVCPPEEAPYGLTPAQLTAHQVAEHGGRS